MKNKKYFSRRLKLFFYRVALLFLSLLLVFIIAEISMRAYGNITDTDFRLYMKELKNWERMPSDIFIPDPVLSLRLRPNTEVLATTSDFSVIYKINSKGLRDKEYNYTRSDKKRILAIDTCLTFGTGISYGDRFTDIAEDYFPNLEIINFAFPGYGIDRELVLFANEGIKYSPDYAVLFITTLSSSTFNTDIIANNTINLDNISQLMNNVNNNNNILFLKKDETLFNNNNLLANSYLLSYINYRLETLLLNYKFKDENKKISNFLITRRLNPPPDLDDNTLKNIRLVIEKFNEIAVKNNIKLIIVRIDYTKSGELDFIKDINKNISYYDLTNELANESKKYPLSFKYDSHYNIKTNKFIAEKLIEILPTYIKT